MKTTIKGYDVELEPSSEGPGVQCWVTKNVRGVEYSASLACLQGTGQLTEPVFMSHGCIGEIDVHVDDIDLITEWAETYGY